MLTSDSSQDRFLIGGNPNQVFSNHSTAGADTDKQEAGEQYAATLLGVCLLIVLLEEPW